MSTEITSTAQPDAEAAALEAAPAGARRRRPFDPKLAIASLGIAAGVVLIGFGVLSSVTGDEVTKLPDTIESISPVPDAVQVPSQTAIVVDLAEGYTGQLFVDGVEYETITRSELLPADPDPGTQVDVPAGVVYDDGNETLTFTPGAEVGFDEFAEGNHQVRVIYWKLVDGQGPAARSYSWTFNIV